MSEREREMVDALRGILGHGPLYASEGRRDYDAQPTLNSHAEQHPGRGLGPGNRQVTAGTPRFAQSWGAS